MLEEESGERGEISVMERDQFERGRVLTARIGRWKIARDFAEVEFCRSVRKELVLTRSNVGGDIGR